MRGGHVEIVRALLNKYADIDIRGQVGAPILSLLLAYLRLHRSRRPSYVLTLVFFFAKVNISTWISTDKNIFLRFKEKQLQAPGFCI